jgi:hypothetical protein
MPVASASVATLRHPHRRGAWGRAWALGALLVGLLLPAGVRSDPPQWSFHTFPFAQALNLEAVYEVTHSAPERLVATIRRRGVDIQRVRSEAPALPLNALLADLPEASPALVQRTGFLLSFEGMVVHDAPPDCTPGRSLILIRDTALSYTLIHEFVQSQLRPTCPGEADQIVEARFAAAFRRLLVYQRRLYADPAKLLNPLWRRDILSAQADVARDLFQRIRLGQSQEAIVEKLLSLYIDERSPYFDETRRAAGFRYGEVMINNAVDVYNTLDASVKFVELAVRNLRESVRTGDITPGNGLALTDEDEATAIRAAHEVTAQLAPVRAELQVLMQFYRR